MGSDTIKGFEDMFPKAVDTITNAVTAYAARLLRTSQVGEEEQKELNPTPKKGAAWLQWTDSGWPILPKTHNGKEIVSNGDRQQVVHAYFAELYSKLYTRLLRRSHSHLYLSAGVGSPFGSREF